MIKLLTVCTQALTVLAMILTYLANHWMEVGTYGLNPFFALPIATILMVLPYLIDHYFVENIDEETEDLSCINLKRPVE
jgi:hypothetical protein